MHVGPVHLYFLDRDRFVTIALCVDDIRAASNDS
jgi:hypothetical protein